MGAKASNQADYVVEMKPMGDSDDNDGMMVPVLPEDRKLETERRKAFAVLRKIAPSVEYDPMVKNAILVYSGKVIKDSFERVGNGDSRNYMIPEDTNKAIQRLIDLHRSGW